MLGRQNQCSVCTQQGGKSKRRRNCWRVLCGVHWDTDKTDGAGLSNILLVSTAVRPCDFYATQNYRHIMRGITGMNARWQRGRESCLNKHTAR